MAAKLTDDEIMRRLQKHGISPGPMTDSTRNVYLKKLEKLGELANRDHSELPVEDRRRSKRLTGRGSIDEDDVDQQRPPQVQSRRSVVPSSPVIPVDTNGNNQARSQQGGARAASTAAAAAAAAAARRRSELPGSNAEANAIIPGLKPRQDRRSFAAANGVDVDSSNSLLSPRIGSMSTLSPSATSTPSASVATFRQPVSPVPRLVTRPELPPEQQQQRGMGGGSLFSWLTSGRKGVGSRAQHKDQLDVSDTDFSDTDTAGGNRMGGVKRSLLHRRPVPAFSTGGPGPSSRPIDPSSASVGRPKDSSSFLHTEGSLESWWSRHIPNLILIGLLLLVTVVMGSYFFLRDKHAGIGKTVEMNRLLCKTDDNPNGTDTQPQECLRPAEYETTIKFLTEIFDTLSNYAGDVLCDKPSNQRDAKMSVDSVKQYFKTKLKQDLNDDTLRNALFIIRQIGEQQFGLFALDHDGVPLTASNIGTEASYLLCSRPYVRLSCRIRLAVMWLFGWLTTLVTVVTCLLILVALGYGGYLLRGYWRRLASRRTEGIRDMVLTIARMLQDQMSEYERSPNKAAYLPVSTIRSRLVVTHPRAGNSRTWEEVKHYVYNVESSIGVQDRRGEGEVWQWQGGSGWQGSALSEQSQKSTIYPPTECLKIRNMFTSEGNMDEQSKNRLKQELLKKLVGVGDVYHIGVCNQGKEGLVFVKCADRYVAGRAYQSVHANYFDGNLVTAKFLRADKYHVRYPDAVTCRTALQLADLELANGTGGGACVGARRKV